MGSVQLLPELLMSIFDLLCEFECEAHCRLFPNGAHHSESTNVINRLNKPVCLRSVYLRLHKFARAGKR